MFWWNNIIFFLICQVCYFWLNWKKCYLRKKIILKNLFFFELIMWHRINLYRYTSSWILTTSNLHGVSSLLIYLRAMGIKWVQGTVQNAIKQSFAETSPTLKASMCQETMPYLVETEYIQQIYLLLIILSFHCETNSVIIRYRVELISDYNETKFCKHNPDNL